MGIPPWRNFLSSFSPFLNKCLFTLLKKRGRDCLGFGHVLAYHTQTADRLGQGATMPGWHKLDGAIRTWNPSSREVGGGGPGGRDYPSAQPVGVGDQPWLQVTLSQVT